MWGVLLFPSKLLYTFLSYRENTDEADEEFDSNYSSEGEGEGGDANGNSDDDDDDDESDAGSSNESTGGEDGDNDVVMM